MKKASAAITIKEIEMLLKKELQANSNHFDEKLERLETRIDIKLERLKLDIDDSVRNYRDDVLTKIDGVMKEFETNREDRELKQHRDQVVTKQLADHERRIKKLETN